MNCTAYPFFSTMIHRFMRSGEVHARISRVFVGKDVLCLRAGRSFKEPLDSMRRHVLFNFKSNRAAALQSAQHGGFITSITTAHVPSLSANESLVVFHRTF